MSTEFQKVVSICLHSCVDLVAGCTISALFNAFFTMHDPLTPPGGGNPDFFKIVLSTVVQVCGTVLAAEELRSLMWADPTSDPTGGVVFIGSLFLQPTLLAKIFAVESSIKTKFIGDGNTSSNPEPTQ